MTTPATTVPAPASAPNPRAQEVEEKLRDLQNAHRLAIHMVEEEKRPFATKEQALRQFGTLSKEDYWRKLIDGECDLFSLSLLPSQQTGTPMAPYEASSITLSQYGYLFDLSQNDACPARVVRASLYGLVSGSENNDKFLDMRTLFQLGDEFTAIKDFYRNVLELNNNPQRQEELNTLMELDNARKVARALGINAAWRKILCQKMGTQQGKQLTEQQLDMLGELLGEENDEIFRSMTVYSGVPCAPFNEVLAACQPRHIRAITVLPFKRGTGQTAFFADLQGAVVGLQHLDDGMEVPVVCYDFPRKNIRYIGQGKEELIAAAKKAICTLGVGQLEEVIRIFPYTSDNAHNVFFSKVKEITGVSLRQDGWKDKLNAWIEQEKAVPASVRLTERVSSSALTPAPQPPTLR